FRMDGKHPTGASHHQKVVVVDDSLAFVGGLDLTRCRWDTPEHACKQPLRRDADGKSYGPFHDVQAVVDGAAARALGELARTRWERAVSDVTVPPLLESTRIEQRDDLWPEVTPDLTDIDVAISRTEPEFGGWPKVQEVRQLHLDAIAAARRHLFFENQYFTSGLVADALALRLEEEQGPEVMVLSPQNQSGWLEEAVMGVLRARVHRRLRQADRHQRYRMYCPHIPGLGEQCLNVHSKLFAVDEKLFSIGSANLSNRSMALDTECNLTIEARGEARVAQAIGRLRNRLLAEHLNASVEEVGAEIARSGSLHRTAQTLGRFKRHLAVLDPQTTPELEAMIPAQAMFDAEKPLDPEELVAEIVPQEARKPAPRRLVGLGMLALGLAVLAVAWRWTPLRDYLNLDALVALARGLESLPFTPVAVIGSYVVAGLAMVPVMLLIAVTGIVFGPLEGSLYAIGGTLLSAAVSYGVGAWLGRDTVQRMLGPRMNRLSQRLAKQGVIAMIVIRMLPIAPFTIVNIVAGTSHIRLRDYLIGTFVGMLPGIFITVTFVHNLAEAVRNPSAGTIAVLAAVALALIGLAVGLQKLLRGKSDPAA
ncbi:MAG TPA: VTT domain-containing protein, partial [Noviherbaspirillum sp.]